MVARGGRRLRRFDPQPRLGPAASPLLALLLLLLLGRHPGNPADGSAGFALAQSPPASPSPPPAPPPSPSVVHPVYSGNVTASPVDNATMHYLRDLW